MNQPNLDHLTEEQQIDAVERNPYALNFIQNQSVAVCLAAIRKSSGVYSFVRNQSREVWMELLNKQSNAFLFLKEQTDELCLEALKNDEENGYHVLSYYKKQTEPFCIAVVKLYPFALQYVSNQTKAICEAMARSITYHSVYAFTYVKKEFRSPELLKIAVKRTGNLIQFVTNIHDEEIYLIAVKEKGRYLDYVRKQTPAICEAAIENDYDAFKYVKDQTPELCLKAVTLAGHMLFYVKNQTPDLCLVAINQDETNMFYVKEGMKNPLAALITTNICIAFHSLKLPSYVLFEIINLLLFDNSLTRYQKMQIICRINERNTL